MKKFLALVLVIGMVDGLEAQAQDMGKDISVIDLLADDDELGDETWKEDFAESLTHRINLNNTSAEELKATGLLSDSEIAEIVLYVNSHKPILSTSELMAITSLTYMQRLTLQHICYAGDLPDEDWSDGYSTGNPLITNAKSELYLSSSIPLYTKDGYKRHSAEELQKYPNRQYRGNKYHHTARYSLRTDRIKAGLAVEKDAGETGIDYFNAYAMVSDVGRIKHFVAGNYRVKWGEGLIANTNGRGQKQLGLGCTGLNNSGLRVHSSMAEFGYLHGMGGTIRITPHLNFSMVASINKTDGTYEKDSCGLSSFKTDGLHRTRLECSKKKNVEKKDFGANIEWVNKQWKFSISSLYTRLSVPLSPSSNTPSTKYRRHYPQGKNFSNHSVSYAYTDKSLGFRGEAAVDADGNIATLNQASVFVNGHHFSLIQRWYAARFASINGNSYGENSHVQNEEGLSLLWRKRFNSHLETEAMSDYWYAPWLKYQTCKPSYGTENIAAIHYDFTNSERLTIRYRMKSRQTNYTGHPDQLMWNNTQSIKAQFVYSLHPSLALSTHFSYATVNNKVKNEHGWGVGQRATWHSPNKQHTIAISAAYSQTDSYDTRIYQYDAPMPYTWNSAMLYGQTFHTSLSTTLFLGRGIHLYGRGIYTHLFDRNETGSSQEHLTGKNRTSFDIGIRWNI